MKKIYSRIERLVCILAVFLLSLIASILFVKFNDEIILVVIAYVCIMFIVLALMKLFCIPSHIIINEDKMKVFDFPLLATNKFYDKKRNLILYNGEIDINEIVKIEVVKLTKEEQKKYIGYRHLFNKFLKFTLKYDSSKYVYIHNYSKFQIKKIINIIKKVANY